jgi:hypothetical protein
VAIVVIVGSREISPEQQEGEGSFLLRQLAVRARAEGELDKTNKRIVHPISRRPKKLD